MSRLQSLAKWASTCAVALLVSSGCVQMPTEKQSVVDMRPQISFQIASERGRTATIVLDGEEMGVAGTYPENVASMKIVPGTHHLRLQAGGETILDERFYIGDGVHRAFLAK